MALRSGFSDSAFLIFYAIAELGEGCLQKDIADRYFISRQTVSSSIRVLERKGYLFLKPGRRRDMHIFLTDSGKEILENRLHPFLVMEDDVIASMPTEERQGTDPPVAKVHQFVPSKIKYFIIGGGASQCSV